MRKLSLVCLIAALLSSPTAIAFTPQLSTDPNLAEQYLQQAADQERAGLNLPPLQRDLALVSAARLHARQMVEHNSISHQFSQEPDLAARAAATGARFSRISENVAESPSAIKIHVAWMNSEGHRHNLLDPNVDAVGIAVIARGRQLFAVEDFERSLPAMTLKQQENAVAQAIVPTGIAMAPTDAAALRTCSSDTGSSGSDRAAFIMRYTTADLTRLPEQLRSKLATGRYATAVVAACPFDSSGSFSMYRIAVLLYLQSGN